MQERNAESAELAILDDCSTRQNTKMQRVTRGLESRVVDAAILNALGFGGSNGPTPLATMNEAAASMALHPRYSGE